jgi:pyroglutamyl-peptidase
MHEIAIKNKTTKAGFIHLPYLHEQTIPKLIDQASMSLESIVEGVRLAIEVSLEQS